MNQSTSSPASLSKSGSPPGVDGHSKGLIKDSGMKGDEHQSTPARNDSPGHQQTRTKSSPPPIDEPVDPRVQIELENLNTLTDLINKLELELDVSQRTFMFHGTNVLITSFYPITFCFLSLPFLLFINNRIQDPSSDMF